LVSIVHLTQSNMENKAQVSTWWTSHINQESRKELHNLFKDNQVIWGSSENQKIKLDFHDLIQYMPDNREVTHLETFLMDVEAQVNGWPLEPGDNGYDEQPRYQGDVQIPHIEVWDDAVLKSLLERAKPFGEACWIAYWKKARKWRYLIYGRGERDPTDEQSRQAAAEALDPALSFRVQSWMRTFEPRSTRSSIADLTRGASISSILSSQTDFDPSTQFST
jgi:hypothetical protein